jgi:predicted TIM-barrel fold metal-dependent hydrolase
MNDPEAERYLVISADTHAGLPGPEYRDWLDPEYRERFDAFLVERARAAEMAKAGFLNEEFAKEWQEDNEEGLRGGWDAARRDKELDADGVAGEVIFPDADAVTGGASAPFGAGLGATGDTPGELLLAGARAHNRWLAELCRESPDRRAGVAVVPIIVDVDEAVAEIRRAYGSGLRGGILIPPMWQPHEPYHHERYDPVWGVCEELGLPVHVHSGVADRAAYGPHVGIFTTETRFWSSRPLWFLIWSGVFERFPRLRFGVTECGAFWVSDLLWRMDLVYDRDHGSRKLGSQLTAQMTMRPSEYFDRNCFIGASNIVRVEMARRYEIGVHNLCWGNDFPHPEGTWPHTRKFLASVFRDIPRDETTAMLGTNAAAVYAFDIGALRPLADRIGPTPDELGQDHDPTAKWADARRAGRPWLTGIETWPTANAPGSG